MFWRKKREQDLERELQSHLDLEAEENGGDPYAARRALGNRTLVSEDTRATWGWLAFEQLWRDLTQGARMMRRRPIFTVVAVLSLAIGIGANAAIFSFMNPILIRTLLTPGADRLVLLRQHNEAFHMENCCFVYDFFQRFRAQNSDFEQMAALSSREVSISMDDRPVQRVRADFIAGSYFEMLGGSAALGRLLNDQDNQAEGTGAVAVLSYRLWKNSFGGDPGIVGRRIEVSREPLQIVGVSSETFMGSSLHQPPDLQIPASMMLKLAGFSRDRDGWAQILGRLKIGISPEQAASHANALGQQLSRVKADPRDNIYLLDGSQGINSRKEQFGKPVLVLMLLVGVVLLIACANLAALLLVRSVERAKEAGMRTALGASMGAIFRQFFAESLLLGMAGGVAGIALAWVLIRVFSAFLSAQNPDLIAQVRMDTVVLGFSAGITCAAALLFGVLPAWRAARADPLPAIHGSGVAGQRLLLSRAIIGAQVALSLALLFSAGLFVRTLANLRAIDLGFQAENVITFRPLLDGTVHAGPQRLPFFRELLRRTREMPGVRYASLGDVQTLSGGMMAMALNIPGFVSPNGQFVTSMMNVVSREYFQTLEIPLTAGEDFPDSVPDGSVLPVIVNTEFARQFLSGNPLGQRFHFAGGLEVQIIGVAGVAKYRNLREDPQPIFYRTFTGLLAPSFLQVRTTANPERTIEQLRAAMNAIDPKVSIESVSTMEMQLDQVLGRERLLAFLSTALGGVAVALSAIGLYGVVAFSVARRTREIGIRIAIGSQRSGIVALFLRDAAWPVVAGLLLGVPLAFASGRLMETLLYGLKPQDPVIATEAIGLLLLAAIAAAIVPAWRAARIDPFNALRRE